MVYSVTSIATDVNTCRILFANGASVENIPPTSAALRFLWSPFWCLSFCLSLNELTIFFIWLILIRESSLVTIFFYYFYHHTNVHLKLISYFVQTGFNKVLRTHFFVINFLKINWLLLFYYISPQNLLRIKLISWKDPLFLTYGFYVKQPE